MRYVSTHAHFGYGSAVFVFVVDIARSVFEELRGNNGDVKSATPRTSRFFPIGLHRRTNSSIVWLLAPTSSVTLPPALYAISKSSKHGAARISPECYWHYNPLPH